MGNSSTTSLDNDTPNGIESAGSNGSSQSTGDVIAAVTGKCWNDVIMVDNVIFPKEPVRGEIPLDELTPELNGMVPVDEMTRPILSHRHYWRREHQIVVIDTSHSWWSLEKCGDGVTVRCGRDLDDMLTGMNSIGRWGKKTDIQDGPTVRELIRFLMFNRGSVMSGYHIVKDNCWSFGAAIDGFLIPN
eukprot:GHVN01092443.1.p1 GENE.GHVN01092443.1~~GHVN01092443.1.p1  ORF type:complete len:188 (+),score=37.55 GHVN01092443.1:540-1103(+)